MASHTSGVETRCDNHSGVTTIGFLRVEELLDHLLHDGNSGATFANHTIMIIDPPLTTKTALTLASSPRQRTRNRPPNMVPNTAYPARTAYHCTPPHHATSHSPLAGSRFKRKKHAWKVRFLGQRPPVGSGPLGPPVFAACRVACPPRPDSRHTPVQETRPALEDCRRKTGTCQDSTAGDIQDEHVKPVTRCKHTSANPSSETSSNSALL